MDVEIRACVPDDAAAAAPLIYSSGPAAFRGGQSHACAAVHAEDLAGDVGGFVACEEVDGFGDFGGTSFSAEGCIFEEFLAEIAGDFLGHFGGDESWGDDVDGNVSRGEFFGE